MSTIYYVPNSLDVAVRTCFDLILEGIPTIHENLVKILRFVGQTEIHDVSDLVGLVEIQDFGLSVIGLSDEVHQDFQDFFEKV